MFRALRSVRSLSTSAVSKQDLIQEAFIKKIREYAQKGGDLSSSDPAVKKALTDELNRLAAKFQLANSDVVGKLPTSFETPKVDSSVQQLLEGSSLSKMIEDVRKEKDDYLAAREAKKAAEAARLAALKQ
ncbi:ATP synthase subunit [Trichostrongylus colubriformis]|uniref:ATP synthase subunit n=1 Tax=Trichostrongylus colubriformis TaxID=6319 RepID=A0AAN8ESW9_TRICO